MGIAVALAWLVPGATAAAGSGLLNAHLVTLQGVQLANGGCRYALVSDLAPGQHAIEQDVVSEDAASCSIKVREGVPSDPSVYSDPPGGASAASGVMSAKSSASKAEAPASQTTSAGYRKAWYEDPITADVNNVVNHIKWTWNGSDVVGTFYCSDTMWWLTDTGWYPFYHDLNCNTGSSGQANSATWEDYENDIFCAGHTTYAFYDRNHAWGWGNGHLTGETDAVATGGCANLLKLHTVMVRTSN